MKNKRFNLFVTSDDVGSFGNSYSVSKFLLYFIGSFILLSFFFSLFGIYFLFFSSSEIDPKISLTYSSDNEDSDKAIFLKDPVHFQNNSEFETSFITSNFSDNHMGIDINGSIGTKIYSPISGKVIYQGFDKKAGNLIIVSHNNGYITKYMHNKKNFVQIGDMVNPDKAIAEMGNSGASIKNEGIHLHFELWKNGVVIDPSPFIKNLKSIDTHSFVSNK